ncbi:two-component system response regulator [candidate division GN15 bacterium]|uniref:Two-component system response regulator n=1 Tax=candidate division GN15 bacterium TaxID=2072418 RepID=A0A855X3X0_9BACT|nr:MAG: two-component system response regulator [candidate division GN15 bacterium]
MKSATTVLIVDDEPVIQSLLEKILSREGYKTFVAGDGATALKMLESQPVSLVLSDIKMPGMSGFDLLKEIKSRYPRIGVIIMTAYGDTFTVKDALLLGADEYITKPFKSYEVSLVVERAYWRIMSASAKVES